MGDLRQDRTFRWALWGIAALALAIRIIYLLGWHSPTVIGGDAFYYHFGANLFADGHGFPHPYRLLQDGVDTPGAQHPPLYIVVLGLGSLIGLRSFLAHQILSCVLGTVTVVLLGLVGKRIAGRSAGLLAAGLGAVYPNLWLNDPLVLSETLVQLSVVATVLAAYELWRRRTLGRAAVLGAVVALATLTRAEGAVLAVAVVLPMCLARAGGAWRSRLALLAASAAACAAVLAPWFVYNIARFDRPVLISTGLDPTLVVTNCDDTYRGTFKGYWSYQCIARLPPQPGDDSVAGEAYRKIALDYVSAHRSEVPGVVLARVGRTWGLYRPGQEIVFDTVDGRNLPASRVGLGMFYGLALLSVAGAVLLRRRRVPLAPVVGPIVMSVLAPMLAGGLTRYRAAAEISLVLLASVALSACVPLVRNLRARHLRPREGAGTGPP